VPVLELEQVRQLLALEQVQQPELELEQVLALEQVQP
jgi:hypothetical protein